MVMFKNKWNCPACTFENEAGAATCGACGTARVVQQQDTNTTTNNNNNNNGQDKSRFLQLHYDGDAGSIPDVVPFTGGSGGAGGYGGGSAGGAATTTPIATGFPIPTTPNVNNIPKNNNNNNNATTTNNPIPVPAADEWACPICTLVNKKALAKCAACNGNRPASLAGAAVGDWVKFEMSQMEYDHLVAVFYRFLRGDHTQMNRDEMKVLCRFLNFAHSDEQINAMFAEMDRDRSGRLSVDEFLTWSASHRPDPQSLYGLTREDYHAVLFSMDKYDRNHDGFLSREECIMMAMDKGLARTLEQAQQICSAIDVDGDGKITLHELLVGYAGITRRAFQ